MIAASLEKTVNALTDSEKIELIKKLADSIKISQTPKRESLRGQFNFKGITDADIEDAKKIWR